MQSPGLEVRPDQQVTLPGLERVVEPWGAVEGRRPRRESVDLSKPIACKLGGGKAPRLSEVHCDRDSVCVKT